MENNSIPDPNFELSTSPEFLNAAIKQLSQMVNNGTATVKELKELQKYILIRERNVAQRELALTRDLLSHYDTALTNAGCYIKIEDGKPWLVAPDTAPIASTTTPKEETKNPWILVKDELPTDYAGVLAFVPGVGIRQCFYHNGFRALDCHEMEFKHVMSWTPLEELYKTCRTK